jgi:5-methylcytosine-specific restriction endonuclease McrA
MVDEKKTEPRTLRSKAKRALLWRAAGGLCQRCGAELGDDWEADHIVPWSVTHRTNLHEMQALCGVCNRAKGAKRAD